MVSGRKIRCTTQLSVNELQALPTVTSVIEGSDSVVISAMDSDAAVRALLLADATAHGLEISGAALEDAFMELTKD
jgi:ABC-2 type transport system ATP-binding protein